MGLTWTNETGFRVPVMQSYTRDKVFFDEVVAFLLHSVRTEIEFAEKAFMCFPFSRIQAHAVALPAGPKFPGAQVVPKHTDAPVESTPSRWELSN